MSDETISDQCCRGDERLRYIKNIIRSMDAIQRELNDIRDAIDNSKTEGDAIEKIRTFEGIAKTRYHANSIITHGRLLKQLTFLLEREIIEIEG